MRREAAPWWRQAQADLDAARTSLGAGHAFAASWLAHQAVELGLKALFLERRGALAPRTHDLLWLGRAAAAPAAVVARLAYLNPVFQFARYPDPITAVAPVDLITSAAAAQDVQAAEESFRWIRHELKP